MAEPTTTEIVAAQTRRAKDLHRVRSPGCCSYERACEADPRQRRPDEGADAVTMMPPRLALGPIDEAENALSALACLQIPARPSGNAGAYSIRHDDIRRARAALDALDVVKPLLTPAATAVLSERRRQVEEEGWSAQHDDAHDQGRLAQAAACYALPPEILRWLDGNDVRLWPWDMEWFKPKDRRRDLVRAAALILAELERLDRADLRASASPRETTAGAETAPHGATERTEDPA